LYPTLTPPPPPPLPLRLLREYLELEFADVATPFPLDIERIVDDFVLFCMLIGNDFLPGGGWEGCC